MHEIVIIAYLLCLPQKSNIFKLIYSYTFSWYKFWEDAINSITVDFSLKGKIVAFICYDLKSYLNEVFVTSLS